MKPDFAGEFYVIEKTVELVFQMRGESETVRIEALRGAPAGGYSIRARILRHFVLQPSFPLENGIRRDPPGDYEVWVPLAPALPWVDEATADEAIERALGWLKQYADF
ncbi:hypothetical protein V5F77_24120 [Xanthobacter sp. DSM 24535]|uniref:hypothetical protein n=1 Tax=Roseixanthobacter psychrophilus TaxID=3119917 RepID=UPI00372A5860